MQSCCAGRRTSSAGDVRLTSSPSSRLYIGATVSSRSFRVLLPPPLAIPQRPIGGRRTPARQAARRVAVF